MPYGLFPIVSTLGSIRGSFGSRVAGLCQAYGNHLEPIWHHFGSLWAPNGTNWAPLEAPWTPF